MEKQKFKVITPKDVLIRSKTYPSICIVGPTGSGKSALSNTIINMIIANATKVGVGENNQTTLISTNYLLDSRIPVEHQNHFALKLITRPFDEKLVLSVLIDSLFPLFSKNDYTAEDTIDCMDETWFNSILEPTNASYHLNQLKEYLNLEELQMAITPILEKIEVVDGRSFSELAKEKKSETALQSLKISEVREYLFNDLWSNLDQDTTALLTQWLNNVGKVLWMKLKTVMKVEDQTPGNPLVIEGTITNEDNDPSSEILSQLYDPKAPYSLIIKEIFIACRPNQQLLSSQNENQPFRFCLRDTVGVNQTSSDINTIRTGLDIGMAYHADLLVVLLSLEERKDTLTAICNLVAEHMRKNESLKVPVKVLFTKADKVVDTKISQNMSNLMLSQNDYDNNIERALEQLDQIVETYARLIPDCHAEWVSLRYREQEFDPIQKALVLNTDSKYSAKPFMPEGIYQTINNLVQEIQCRSYPRGITNPLFVTVADPNAPAISIHVNGSHIREIVDVIQYQLTQEKSNVNGYLLPKQPVNGYKVSPWSVNHYWWKLQIGLGHKTNATSGKYINFSINMKGLLGKVLRNNLKTIDSLYQLNAISTITDNLSEKELVSLLDALHTTPAHEELAFHGWNPDSINKMEPYQKYVQILHYWIREYFQDPIRQAQIFDRLAFQLSFGNNSIEKELRRAYYAFYSHDRTMRNVQHRFKEIFESDDFQAYVVEEIGSAMTDMINKLFISI